jgi:D-lactate dehydrogenase (cytochrome)
MTALAFEALIGELAGIGGANLSTATAVREHHARGESHHPAALPHAVVFPESTEAVQAIVRACATHRCPVVPFGAGSSLEGHVNAIHGGVSIDMTRMNRILRVGTDDLDATVEAGVTRKQLEKHLRSTGLIFHLDPGADATLGGMAATRASGTTAVRYGTMRDAVLGLTVVLADGRVISTGGRARKSSSGYDLTKLFVGRPATSTTSSVRFGR